MSGPQPTDVGPSPQAAGSYGTTPRSPQQTLNSSKSNQVVQQLNAEAREVMDVAGKRAEATEARQVKSWELITSVSDELNEAIEVLNEALAKTPTRAMIAKDEQLNRFVVKIADKTSGEIVREIPSEALLKFARHLQELKGILFDEKT